MESPPPGSASCVPNMHGLSKFRTEIKIITLLQTYFSGRDRSEKVIQAINLAVPARTDLDEHLLLKVTYEMIFNEQNLHNNYDAYNLRGSKELER